MRLTFGTGNSSNTAAAILAELAQEAQAEKTAGLLPSQIRRLKESASDSYRPNWTPPSAKEKARENYKAGSFACHVEGKPVNLRELLQILHKRSLFKPMGKGTEITDLLGDHLTSSAFGNVKQALEDLEALGYIARTKGEINFFKLTAAGKAELKGKTKNKVGWVE